jgi:hypothetical protein
LLKRLTALPLAILSIAAITAADARHTRHTRHTRHKSALIVCNQRGCTNQPAATQPEPRRIRTARYSGSEHVVGGRPTGCPHEFCGCEASLYLYGEIRPELNLAANWMWKFPHASPAPGMAAARPGHVMVLVKHIDGDDWFVHDGNSGGGLTRDHVRSIRGYTIVDPQVTMLARRLPAAKKQLAALLEKREVSAKSEAAAPLQVADASPDIPLPPSRKRQSEVSVEEMAAVRAKRVPFPDEWIVAMPLEQVPPMPFARVASIRADRVSLTDTRTPPATREPAAAVPVQQAAAIPPAPAPLPRERIAAVQPEHVAESKPERVTFPRERIDAILPAREAAIPVEHVPLPRERVAVAQPEYVATIPAERVPLPRERVAVAQPEYVATIPAEHVPLPRERIVVAPPEQVAAIPAEHVPLPRERMAAVPIQPVAAIPPAPAPLPHEQMAAVPPEQATIADHAMAEGQLRQAAVMPTERRPVPHDRMTAAPAAAERVPASHHGRTRHSRRPEPNLIERAASAASGALKKIFEPTPTRRHHRRS